MQYFSELTLQEMRDLVPIGIANMAKKRQEELHAKALSIKEQIQRAANEGQTFCNVSTDNFTNEMRMELQSLGFTVRTKWHWLWETYRISWEAK